MESLLLHQVTKLLPDLDVDTCPKIGWWLEYLAGYIEIANLLNLLEKKSQKKNPAHHSVKKLTTRVRVRAVLLPRLC